jgi:hypothetical protein
MTIDSSSQALVVVTEWCDLIRRFDHLEPGHVTSHTHFRGSLHYVRVMTTPGELLCFRFSVDHLHKAWCSARGFITRDSHDYT